MYLATSKSTVYRMRSAGPSSTPGYSGGQTLRSGHGRYPRYYYILSCVRVLGKHRSSGSRGTGVMDPKMDPFLEGSRPLNTQYSNLGGAQLDPSIRDHRANGRKWPYLPVPKCPLLVDSSPVSSAAQMCIFPFLTSKTG